MPRQEITWCKNTTEMCHYQSVKGNSDLCSPFVGCDGHLPTADTLHVSCRYTGTKGMSSLAWTPTSAIRTHFNPPSSFESPPCIPRQQATLISTGAWHVSCLWVVRQTDWWTRIQLTYILIIGFCSMLRVILSVNNTFFFATTDKVFYYVASVLKTCFGPYIRPSSGEFKKY
jgi:hypothetical protein